MDRINSRNVPLWLASAPRTGYAPPGANGTTEIVVIGGGIVGLTAALLLRRAALALPRLTLPGALRWCWWRALPLAVGGLVYLMIV